MKTVFRFASDESVASPFDVLVRFATDEYAATAIEYGLIAACISIAIIVAVQGVGSKLNSTFTQVQNALN